MNGGVYLSGSEQANSGKDDKLCHFTGPEYVRHTIFPSRVQVPVPTDSVLLSPHVEGGGLSR
jgi:hypothetical protein